MLSRVKGDGDGDGDGDSDGETFGLRRVCHPGSALVLFSGRRGAWWSIFLRGGWRHCFVMLPFRGSGGCGWILLDPRSGRTDVSVLSASAGGTLVLRLMARGCVVEWTTLDGDGGRGLPVSGCVEFVRRILGLSSFCFSPCGLLMVLRRRRRLVWRSGDKEGAGL